MNKLGFQIIGISPDSPENLKQTDNDQDLKYRLFSDANGKLIKKTGLAFQAFEKPAYSPLSIASQTLIKMLSLQRQMINAGPKLLAARTGMLLSFVIAVMTLAGLSTAALVTASILGIFSLLEATLGFCVACKIYPFLYRWVLKSGNKQQKTTTHLPGKNLNK